MKGLALSTPRHDREESDENPIHCIRQQKREVPEAGTASEILKLKQMGIWSVATRGDVFALMTVRGTETFSAKRPR